MYMKQARILLTYVVIAALALVSALNYQLFIFPNSFAPSGLNGICTMIQYVFHISVGYLSLIVNIPLALAVYVLVNKPLARRSMVYVVSFSVFLLILQQLDLSRFAYETETGTSRILGPLVAGIINGFCYALLVRCSAYTGGTDFVASLIRRKHPSLNFFWIIFALNCMVAAISFFVYGHEMEPVILCILYSFMSSTVSDRMLKNGRSAIRFEIVTDYPKEISRDVIEQIHHSTTMLPAKGMYHGRETNILVCVVNRSQMTAMSNIIRQYPRTFATMSSVNQVMGNFKHLDGSGRQEKDILDHGDGDVV